ncbi:MAG: protein-export chaperone SecB [Candidatus Izemoplasmatales bacterium]|nr:protein-export chaperone SecB [Candidatus Izemoplasmatales bacterium]MDD5292997.1 protein-export chaperone SecB [Candidatus Izemoplasmatales bacterium]
MQCIVKLDRYYVKNMQFSLDPKRLFKDDEPHFQITPSFHRDITRVDQDNIVLTLSFKIEGDESESPFEIFASLCGHFHIEQWESTLELKKLALNNTTAILFPYLRALVSSITMNANIPPYIIPVFNVVELFEQDKH